MSELDAVPDELFEAARVLGQEAHRMLLVAWTKGFRDGLEAGAKITESVGEIVVEKGGCSYVTDLIAQEMRLSSLGVEAPTIDSGS